MQTILSMKYLNSNIPNYFALDDGGLYFIVLPRRYQSTLQKENLLNLDSK